MRRNVLDDILGENIVQKNNSVMQEEKNNNSPANNVNVEAVADFVNGKTQQAETPQSTQSQPTQTQQVEKTTTPTDNSAFIEKATTKNVFAEKNKDVIAPKSTPAQQGFSIPEPKREEFDTYEKQINFFTPPETEDERLAREKKERSSKNLSALFDGLTALSNIYHTTQYAPPQTLSSGTEKMTQKYDKLRENADKIKKEYQNAILKLRQLDDADYQNAWNRWFALRKQYENGEISKQKMEQEWKKSQKQWDLKEKELGLKEKGLEQNAKQHEDNLKEKAKDRAVAGGNGKLKNLSSHSYSVSLPENTAIDYALIYNQLVNSYANGNKALSPTMLGLRVDNSGKITAREKNPDKIKKIALLHFGASKDSLAYMRELEKNPNMKEYEPSEEVEDYQPVIDYKPKK